MDKKLHYENIVEVSASPAEIFSYADNFANFSSHMNKSSWMMAGSKMATETDEGNGQRVGSHIRMNGNILGINVHLDEVITLHESPLRKAWETVGDLNLLVVDHYKLGFEIEEVIDKSKLRVYIDYNLPQTYKTRLLGYLFGSMYAKWCVNQMVNGVSSHFNKTIKL